MNSISKNMLLEIAYKLPVKTLHKLSLIGFNHLFDNRFWQKYCIKRNIILSTYPWIQRAYLWEKRRPVWTILDETPWDPNSQNPKVVWGLDDNQVIEYSESETASAIVINDIIDVIEQDVTSGESSTHTTNTGFYKTKYTEITIKSTNSKGNLVEKICKVMYFVRYCPYDQCHVGYCIMNGDKILSHINRSISYSGEVSDGLRQGSGILTFENGFIIDSDDLDNNYEDDNSESAIEGIPWNDKWVVNSNIGENFLGLSFITMDRLSQILETYIYWCLQVGIFNHESI